MVSDQAEKFYTQSVDAKYGERYEDVRWHRDAISESHYAMTSRAIEDLFIQKSMYTRCLELGPGGGTWTRSLLAAYPNATYELVDISKKMLEKAKVGVGKTSASIVYTTSDFNEFKTNNTFDCFFSIRAFEYVTDKKKAVRQIHDLLETGGSVFIITKMPHYVRARIMGRSYSRLHHGQITPSDLRELFAQANFTGIEAFPVTFTFPLLGSAKMNTLLAKIFGGRKINFLSAFFTESYALKCTKS